MSKMQNLQSALNRSTGRTPAVSAKETTATAGPKSVAIAGPGKRQSGREGKFNLSSWQPIAFKSSLRLVQAHKGGDPTIEELLREALNDLFMKYKVPTVTGE